MYEFVLSETSILSTDAAHSDLDHFSGNYIVTHSTLTATEAFVAEMADYTKAYEFETYGNLSLVSYANEIRTADLIDTPFLDSRCHNAYSQDPDDIEEWFGLAKLRLAGTWYATEFRGSYTAIKDAW